MHCSWHLTFEFPGNGYEVHHILPTGGGGGTGVRCVGESKGRGGRGGYRCRDSMYLQSAVYNDA